MRAVFAGVLKPDVRENPDAYYDRAFDVFESYYDTSYYWLPGDWQEKHGPGKEMDWGSWLYITDRKGLDELLDLEENVIPTIPAKGDEKCAKRLRPIKAKDIPAAEWYGVLEVECY